MQNIITLIALVLLAGCATEKTVTYTTPKLQYEQHAPKPPVYSHDPLVRVPPK